MFAENHSLPPPSLPLFTTSFQPTTTQHKNSNQVVQDTRTNTQYSTTAVLHYLLSLTPSNDLDATFDAIAEHKQILQHRLLGYATDSKQVERGVRIVGDGNVSMTRVPTICFVVSHDHWHKSIRSQDIVEAFDKRGGV